MMTTLTMATAAPHTGTAVSGGIKLAKPKAMMSRKKASMMAGLCCKNTGHDDDDDFDCDNGGAPHKNGGVMESYS
jgi:hypothetical protein